ncbi:calcineurin subunit B type 1-like [Symsagittifera roscoffensis]|uniref:calcineurin subunit B type 1-like n=1 Tax=Symsagittifera roscoffensis TaxID=84072 RepID=UPI00307B1852
MPRNVSQNFSHEEMQRLNLRFRKLDKDHSGTLSVSELMVLPDIPKNKLISRILNVLDRDGDGEIDFHEFIHGLSQFSVKGDETQKMRFAFNIYDVNGDGYISNSELYHVLKIMAGSNLSTRQLQQVVDKTMYEADTDGDNRLSFSEFCRVVKHLDVFRKMSLHNV